MTTDRRDSRIAELFGQARALGQDEQRRFLNEQCTAEEEPIRREVESLLDVHRDAPQGDFHNPLLPSASLARGFDAVFNDPYIGQKLGPYRLKEHIATGGFGVIYLAFREDDFHQKVAVKILRPEQHERDQLLRRFELERQLLADLEHEYIAHLISGGTTDAGDPYFAMEYVEGIPLTRYCDEQKLSIDQRLELFEKVCTAVMHAHQYGVIHRDIKPSNVLVTGSGNPKLLDFGIAKLFDPILQKRMISITQTEGVIPMTPLYASPEQVRSQRVSTATDVYCLGVMLYEIVSGRNPHAIANCSAEEVRKAICEHQPTPPSTAVSQTPEPGEEARATEVSNPHEISQLRKMDLRRLQKHLSGDLDNIVLMALRKEPERRYASAAELRDDIRRYRNGKPVRARNNTLFYTAKRMIGRHYVATAACAVALLALMGGSAIATLGWMNARAANLRANEAAARWKLQLAIRQWERGEFLSLEETLSEDFGVSRELNSSWEHRYFRHLVRDLPSTLDVGKQITGMSYDVPTGRMSLGHLDGTVSVWRRDPLWAKVTEWRAHPGEVLDVAWHPSGQMIATAGRDESIKLWESDSFALVAKNELPVNRDAPDTSWQDDFLNYRRIAWRPQGDRLAIPTSTTVAVFSADNLDRLPDVDLHCPQATAAIWSPEGESLAAGGLLRVPAETSSVVWKSFATGEVRKVSIPGRTMSLAWLERDDRVVVGIAEYPGLKGLIGICDFQTEEYRTIASASNKWTDVVWAGHDCGLVFGGADGFVRNATLKSDSASQKWQLHRGSIEKVVWDSRRGEIITADVNGVARVCRPEQLAQRRVIEGFGRVAWSPDSKRIAATARSTGQESQTRVHLFDAATGNVIQKLEAVPYGWVSSLAWQPQDDYIVGTISDGRVVRWGRQHGHVERILEASNPFSIAIHPQGDRFAFGDKSEVIVHDLENTDERFHLGNEERTAGVTWSPSGRFLAAVCDSQLLVLWNVDRKKEILRTHLCEVEGKGFGQFPVAWHPTEDRFATIDALGRLSIWEIDASNCLHLNEANGHNGPAWCVAWSPDGQRIATGGLDAQVILWNSSNLRKVLHFDQETAVGTVSWSPDGRFLVAEGGHADGRLEIRYAP